MSFEVVVIAGLCILLAYVAYVVARADRTAASLHRAGRAPGIEGLNSVLDLLGEWDAGNLPSAIRRPLIESLGSLDADEISLLDAKRRKILSAQLRRGHADSTHLSILKALEKLCEKESVPDIEWIADSGRSAEVRRSAAHCLKVMQKKWDAEAEKERLLRPARESSNLLMPSSGAVAEFEESLLRPMHEE